MNRFDIIELGKIYKRLLDVEITLKSNFMLALTATYPKKEFNRLLPYLINNIPHSKYLSGRGQNKRDRINDIINSKQTQQDKLTKFFQIAYLSDVLKLLTDYKKLKKDKAFKRNFYSVIPPHTLVEAHASKLNSLRNAIMHFDFDKYCANKADFLNSLAFWEKLIFCPNYTLHNLSPAKPTTANLLDILAQNYPGAFKMNDRLLCDLFDDFAFMNGIQIKDLPAFWTIGREIYRVKKKYNL